MSVDFPLFSGPKMRRYACWLASLSPSERTRARRSFVAASGAAREPSDPRVTSSAAADSRAAGRAASASEEASQKDEIPVFIRVCVTEGEPRDLWRVFATR